MTGSLFAKSDRGLRRENNEDRYLIVDDDEEAVGRLYAVADGMGGHAAGEAASRMACAALREQYLAGANRAVAMPQAEQELLTLLENTMYDIHRKLTEFSARDMKFSGMGTTLSALLLWRDKALIAHVGDSRIYRFRQGRLEQLTEDHTELQRYVAMGRLTKEEAAEHHLRHILSQVIGGRNNSLSQVFTTIETLRDNDRFLLCSDGLYEMVKEREIEQILREEDSIEEAGEILLQKALDNGGKDNVTVVLTR